MAPERPFAEVYAAARAGDRNARDELARELLPALQRYVERRAGRDVRRLVEPADLAQTALLTFLDRLATFPATLDAPTLHRYLLRIARWTIADVIKRRRLVLGESAVQRLDPESPTPTTGPVTRADERVRLDRLLARLQPAYADVLRRVLLDGRPAAEVAAELGIDAATVRKRLERARAEFARLAGPGAAP